MRCRECGMALVTILFLLASLLVLALMLSEKIIRATRSATLAGARDQARQAAGAGIEWTRHRLATTYSTSSGWANYLAGAPDGERYPDTPAFSTVIGSIPVDIFLRDNPDGDADPRRDNDLKLLILACARPIDGSAVLVESLCGFDPDAAAGYRQGGSDARRSGQSTADGLAEPWSAPVATFHLRE
ncbi:MAG: hypothetical protein NDI73_10465 [Desulfuromonadales bacterium]|nr:hypothetical protein [Desulfuromonadales bacterium]